MSGHPSGRVSGAGLGNQWVGRVDAIINFAFIEVNSLTRWHIKTILNFKLIDQVQLNQ